MEETTNTLVPVGPFTVGSQVEIKCVEGYKGVHDMTVYCGEDLMWTEFKGSCKGKPFLENLFSKPMMVNVTKSCYIIW